MIDPEAPFGEESWPDVLNELIYCRKKIRQLELLAVGTSNDLNNDSLAVTQDSESEQSISPFSSQTTIQTFITKVLGGALVAMHGFSAINTGTQAVNVNTTSQLTFNATLWDSDGAWNLSTGVFTAPRDGVYLLAAAADAATAVGAFNQTGSLILRTTARDYTSAFQLLTAAVPQPIGSKFPVMTAIAAPLTAGDQVSLYFANAPTSGANMTVADIVLSGFTIG